MQNNVPITNIGLGILSGATSAWRGGVDRADARKDAEIAKADRRAEALRNKQIGEYKLAQLGRQDALEAGQQDSKLALLVEQTNSQTAELRRSGKKLAKRDMYDTIRLTLDNGDTRAFNRYLQDSKNDPYAPKAFKNTVRIDKLNLQDPEDQNKVLELGVPREELDKLDGTEDGIIDWDVLTKRFFKTTNVDGTVEVKDMLQTAISTGYGDYADARSLSKMERLAKITKDKNTNAPKPPRELAAVRYAREAGEAKKRLENNEGRVGDQELVEQNAEITGGNKAGNKVKADVAKQKWLDAGYDNFTFEELQSNQGARSLIRTIEIDKPLSNADEKDLKELRVMSDLLTNASNLSEKQVGLFDAPVARMFSYINNDTVTKQDKMMYEGLVTTFRHNAYGAALTDSEIAAFNKAYGTDGMKVGPILAGLRSMATQINSKMTAISHLNNDMVLKFRAGQTREDIQRAKAGIELRLEFLNLIESGMSPREAAKAVKESGKGSDYLDREVTPNQRAEVPDVLAPEPALPNQPEKKAAPLANYTVDDVTKALQL